MFFFVGHRVFFFDFWVKNDSGDPRDEKKKYSGYYGDSTSIALESAFFIINDVEFDSKQTIALFNSLKHEGETSFFVSYENLSYRNCYKDFPKGTIHIIGVNPESNDNCPHIIVENHQQYFIGADNGIFSLLFRFSNQEKYSY